MYFACTLYKGGNPKIFKLKFFQVWGLCSRKAYFIVWCWFAMQHLKGKIRRKKIGENSDFPCLHFHNRKSPNLLTPSLRNRLFAYITFFLNTHSAWVALNTKKHHKTPQTNTNHHKPNHKTFKAQANCRLYMF